MNILDEVKMHFRHLRESTVKAMQALYQVKEEGAWQSVANNWGEYVESELGISQGFASKLLIVNKHYLLEGGLSPEKIEGTDYECLYLAAKTEGTVQEQLSKAKTLTRRELREDKNEDTNHVHEPISICKTCSIRL